MITKNISLTIRGKPKNGMRATRIPRPIIVEYFDIIDFLNERPKFLMSNASVEIGSTPVV